MDEAHRVAQTHRRDAVVEHAAPRLRGRYNALIQRLVSFEQALECVGDAF